MDDNEIKRDIKSIIAKIARIDPDGISDTDSLRHDLSIDSLQASQIIGMIDDPTIILKKPEISVLSGWSC